MAKIKNKQTKKNPSNPIATRVHTNGSSHLLLVRTQNGTATLEASTAVSYETKQSPTIQVSHHVPRYLPN